jgi:ATP-dependent Lon protease
MNDNNVMQKIANGYYPSYVREFVSSKDCREDQKDWIYSLPWQVVDIPDIDIKEAESLLEKSHYGLKDVKQRIIEYISIQKHLGGNYGAVLLLVGPPGVGKTSICKTIAQAMKREFVKISMGGLTSSHELKGLGKKWKNAEPSPVTKAIRRCGSLCPVILLDEIEKLGKSKEFGDPQAVLLEMLDTNRTNFVDGFIELPIDLSNVVFIATANDISEISEPLLDRMEVIDLKGYSSEEKIQIAKEYIIPEEMKTHKLSQDMLQIKDSALRTIVEEYTQDPGIRQLNANIKTICRKAVYFYVTGKQKQLVVDKNLLPALLGRSSSIQLPLSGKPEVGVVNALAVMNSGGGITLPVEVSIIPGDGDVFYTGGITDEIRESCEVVMSLICIKGEKLGVKSEIFDLKDVHVHALMPSVKKSGPSMGIALYTAFVSALLGVPVRNDIAITGEITLRGNVMPVGAIHEKITAAYRSGLRTVIIPYDNRHDLAGVSKAILEEMEIILVSEVDEVVARSLA